MNNGGKMNRSWFAACATFLTIFAFIGLLVGVNGALAASVNQGNGYGPIIYRGSGGQDYEPSAVLLSSELRVWTCGMSQQGTDTIFLTILNLAGNRVWGPYQVLSNSPGYADSQSACSPSVLLVGSEYRMYYECGTTFFHPSICFAKSPDGMNWMKVGVVIPSPIAPTTSWDGQYGIGHPSAVVDRDNTNLTVLYFYDNTCGPGCQVVRGWLLDNADGVRKTAQFQTNFLFPMKVKYYLPGATYVATSIADSLTNSDAGWFGIFTSTNGITFTPAGGLQVPGNTWAEDPGQLVANSDGWIRSDPSVLEVLIGAGQPQWPSTWGVYVRQFGLNLP